MPKELRTIIHLSSSLGGGGAEQMVFQLARHSNADYKTIVVSINSLNTLEEKFIQETIEVYFLNISSFRNSTLTKGLKQLHRIVKNQNGVVFHCHQFHGGLLGMLYNLRYTSVPLVYTMHTNRVKSFSRRLLLFSTKWLRKKDIIFSKNSRKWYLKNSAIIPNGVDFKALSPKNDRNTMKQDPFVFLFLGRLSTPKNPLALITFVKDLTEKNITNFKIHIVGDGKLKLDLEKEIKIHQLESYFRLFGFQHDIISHLSASHCLILPSLWEGMPVSVIEAAASKLPVITTPVGSIPDFLNSENAMICELGTFSEGMANLISDYNSALERSEKLYSDIKSIFGIQSVYQKHIELYKSAL